MLLHLQPQGTRRLRQTPTPCLQVSCCDCCKAGWAIMWMIPMASYAGKFHPAE